VSEVESYADPEAILMLIGKALPILGNKSDMRSEQRVPTETAQNFANEKKMLFVETSAKTAEHVGECFSSLTEKIVKELDKNQSKRKPESAQNSIDLGSKAANQSSRGRGMCC
jgi:GTPase SAR1 family protein